MEIPLIFEDDYIIAVNKPANCIIHNSYYARNIKSKTLLQLLTEQHNSTYYPIHRLDFKTSGLVLLAKHKEKIPTFQHLFIKNQIQKRYIAVVRGFVNESIEISSPVKHPENKEYKDANTICTPLGTKEIDIAVHPYNSARYSLVELIPKTGRIHQLRIHMNKISHPIVGDYKYGDRFHNRMFETKFKLFSMFLHATSLSFKHPVTKKKININASFSEDWHKLFKLYEWEII